MVRYTVYFNGEQVKVYDIEEPAIFIGRLPENHIPIFNMGISRRHVKIELDASGAYMLTDLNSLNGTLVNGKKVKKAMLASGDEITIGKYKIVYEDLRGEAVVSNLETIVADFRPEDVRRMAQQPAGLQMPPPAAAPPPQMAPPPQAVAPQQMIPPPPPGALPYTPAPTAQPGLPPAFAQQPLTAAAMPPPPGFNVSDDDEEEITGAVLIETTGHVVYRLDRDYLTIGSDEGDDIYAAGFMVNKGFAAVEKRDGGFYISAQKMMAKIKVNGKSVRTHRLEHRDRIEIGSNTFRFMENG